MSASLSSINRLVFVTGNQYVFCKVAIEFLNIAYINFRLQSISFISREDEIILHQRESPSISCDAV
jgi:hypothetical protein